jgi:2-oxoglutarate ferredoxin oxidoreductase subunit alpha
VQRGGPSTGLPTKSEQTDLLQVLYGRNGESPMPVVAATSPTDCFDAAYKAAKIALEHLTPVVLLTDAFIANGSSAWRLPDINELPEIHPHYAPEDQKYKYSPYHRDPETKVRYWAIPGQEGYELILGGLEKDGMTGAISTEPENHNVMDHLRSEKVALIPVPDLEVEGDKDDADLLIVGFGSTYGHLRATMNELRKRGRKVALAQLKYVNPLPKNTADVMLRYPKVVVAEQNLGQLAALLRIRINGFVPYQYNEVKGQPFNVSDLVENFERLITHEVDNSGDYFNTLVL